MFNNILELTINKRIQLTVSNCSINASLVRPDKNTSLGISSVGNDIDCVFLSLALKITWTFVPPTPNELIETILPGNGVCLSTT